MTQEKPQSGELKIRESHTRKLAYIPEFKKEIIPSPQALKKFLELKMSLSEIGERKTSNSLEVEFIGEHGTGENKEHYTKYYKVLVNNKAYFVKETPRAWYSRKGGGTVEVLSMRKVREILRANDIDWAEVVAFKMGYENSFRRYFVSKWSDFLRTSLDKYISRLAGLSLSKDRAIASAARSELFELGKKFSKLYAILSDDFSDVWEGNMSYDPESKKIYIYDLQLHPYLQSNKLGQD